MLPRLLTIALANLLICTAAAPGLAETTKDKNALVGPVRTVTTKTYGQSGTETHDQTGNLVEAVIDLLHGNSSTQYLFHHDQPGHLLEEVAIDPNGGLIYHKRLAYAWDSQGRETAAVAASDDGEFLHAEFSLYDRFGNLTEQLLVHDITAQRSLFDVLGRIVYSARYRKGELFSELTYRYDEGGRLKELVSYNTEGAITGKVVNEYDEAGRRIRATTEQFRAGGSRKWITGYEYDARGNWIRELTSEEPPASQETGTERTYTVQERIIEYYGN